MVRTDTLGFDTGGWQFFADLTCADVSGVMPVAAILLTMTNFQIGLNSPIWWLEEFRYRLQFVPILAIPWISQLPQGVLVYWITSSSVTLGQTLLLRLPLCRTALGLGPKALTNHPSSSPIQELSHKHTHSS